MFQQKTVFDTVAHERIDTLYQHNPGNRKIYNPIIITA
jgi:hypothetical protein